VQRQKMRGPVPGVLVRPGRPVQNQRNPWQPRGNRPTGWRRIVATIKHDCGRKGSTHKTNNFIINKIDRPFLNSGPKKTAVPIKRGRVRVRKRTLK